MNNLATLIVLWRGLKRITNLINLSQKFRESRTLVVYHLSVFSFMALVNFIAVFASNIFINIACVLSDFLMIVFFATLLIKLNVKKFEGQSCVINQLQTIRDDNETNLSAT